MSRGALWYDSRCAGRAGLLLAAAALSSACGGVWKGDGSSQSSGGASAGGSGSSVAGSTGLAGASGTPECVSDANCKVFNDCCNCTAVPAAETPASCHSVCVQSACAALGVPMPQAKCVLGQCVMAFACDSSAVLCKSLPPACAVGQVPLVSDGCWQGGCVPAAQCASVAGCGACTGPLDEMTCVSTGGTSHCVNLPAGCNGQCACLGARVCVGPSAKCTDLSGLHGVACGP